MSGANHPNDGGGGVHAHFPFLFAPGTSPRWRPWDSQIPLLNSGAEGSSKNVPASSHVGVSPPSSVGRGHSPLGSELSASPRPAVEKPGLA